MHFKQMTILRHRDLCQRFSNFHRPSVLMVWATAKTSCTTYLLNFFLISLLSCLLIASRFGFGHSEFSFELDAPAQQAMGLTTLRSTGLNAAISEAGHMSDHQ